MFFLNQHCCISIQISLTSWRLLLVPYWRYISVGLGNGLVPKGDKSIAWTNDGLVHWHIYAARGFNQCVENGNTANDSILKNDMSTLLLVRSFKCSYRCWGPFNKKKRVQCDVKLLIQRRLHRWRLGMDDNFILYFMIDVITYHCWD